MKLATTLLVLASAAALIAPVAHSQALGDIRGSLFDSTGAVMADCPITVKNQDTNQVRSAVTTDAGVYDVPNLVPGTYTVTAQKAGFQTSVRTEVTVQVGQVVSVDFTMQVGQVAEQVEVAGSAQMIDTSTTAVGTVIENKNILELPLNGRDPLQLVGLSPSVTVRSGAQGLVSSFQGGTRANESISVSGERLEFNYYSIDGVANQDVNYNSYIVRPSVEALLEFKVLTGVFPAEYGREPTQILMATRSGTNAFHGTAFEFLRNSALDAAAWNQVGAKNPFRRNEYGFTLSGPILKDKLFFLSNLEELRDRTTSQQIGSVPTPAMRGGDMSAQPHVIYDPLTRTFGTDSAGNPLALSATPFPNKLVPSARFNATTQKLFQYIPLPNQPITGFTNNFITQAFTPTNTDQFTQRVDWTMNAKMNWFGRYSFDNDFIAQGKLFPLSAGGTTTDTWQAVLGNTYVLGPSTVNEFRFAGDYFHNLVAGHNAYKEDVAAQFGIPGLSHSSPAAWGVPSFSPGTGFSGWSESDPFILYDTILQATDNISLTRGAHTLKFGAEIRRDRFNDSGQLRAHGSFSFDGSATIIPGGSTASSGYGLADFLLGIVKEADRTENVSNAMYRSTSVYAYAQDDWKISRKLSLSVGLRYETMQPWADKYCGFANPMLTNWGVEQYGKGLIPGAAPPVLVRPCSSGNFYDGIPFRYALGVQTAVSTSLMGRSLVQHDWKDFAPRLGIAWNPFPNTSVRIAVGRLYAQDIGGPVYDMSRNLTGTDLFINNPQLVNNYMSDPWANETGSTVLGAGSCGTYTGPCLVGSAMYADDYTRRTPYIHMVTFNLQQVLARDLVLEVGYGGSEGHFLQRLDAINQPILRTSLSDARTIAQRQPWPAYGRFNYDHSIANANYNGLSAKVTRRLSHGLTLLAAFTWSHSLDDGSGPRAAQDLPKDAYNVHDQNYGSSGFDQRKRFVLSAVYGLPLGKGKMFLNHGGVVDQIVGGWQLGSILTIADGLPITISTIGDVNSLNQNGNFPNATGISPFLSNPTPQKFWNIAAFDATNPALYYTIGNVGLNTLLEPHTRQWDFSGSKTFKITERHGIQFRFESFNFLNHPIWNAPPSGLLTPQTFGIITSAKTMRQMQLALKYSF